MSFNSPALLYDVPPPPKRKKIAIGLFSASGAAAAAVLVSGGIMIKAKRDFDSTDIQNDAQAAKDRYENARTATIVAGAVSILSTIGGAIAWPKKRPARFTVDANPQVRNYALRAEFSF